MCLNPGSGQVGITYHNGTFCCTVPLLVILPVREAIVAVKGQSYERHILTTSLSNPLRGLASRQVSPIGCTGMHLG